MNNEVQSWKCPDCDTVNSGKRCLVCGREFFPGGQSNENMSESKLKTTIPERKNSSKGLIIALSSIIGVLLIAIIVVCVIAFGGNNEESGIKSEPSSHDMAEEEKEKKEEKEEEKFVKDSIFNINFDITVSKREIEKQPNFSEKAEEGFVCVVPDNFKGLDGNRYFAYDQTGYIRFSSKTLSGETTKDLLKKEKKTFNGRVLLDTDEFNDEGYSLWTVKDEVVYYTRGLVNGEKCISFVFAYPEIYRDIYDDYINEIERGFGFPAEVVEVEVIEEAPIVEEE